MAIDRLPFRISVIEYVEVIANGVNGILSASIIYLKWFEYVWNEFSMENELC